MNFEPFSTASKYLHIKTVISFSLSIKAKKVLDILTRLVMNSDEKFCSVLNFFLKSKFCRIVPSMLITAFSSWPNSQVNDFVANYLLRLTSL